MIRGAMTLGPVTHRTEVRTSTILRVITMTINTKVERSRSAKASGYRFVRSSDVAVVSVTGERDAPSTSLRTVLQACVVRFEDVFGGWRCAAPLERLYLFVATPPSDQHNALSRRRGVWGSNGLTWLPSGSSRSPSVEIAGDDGVRFAGVAELGERDLFEALDFVRTHSGAFLSASANVDLAESRVRSFAKNVFPSGEAGVNWGAALDQLAGDIDICLRATGGFDDRVVVIEAFLSAELLERVGWEVDTVERSRSSMPPPKQG